MSTKIRIISTEFLYQKLYSAPLFFSTATWHLPVSEQLKDTECEGTQWKAAELLCIWQRYRVAGWRCCMQWLDSFSDHGIYIESVCHSSLVVMTYCSLHYLFVDLSKFPLLLELCHRPFSLLKIRRRKKHIFSWRGLFFN